MLVPDSLEAYIENFTFSFRFFQIWPPAVSSKFLSSVLRSFSPSFFYLNPPSARLHDRLPFASPRFVFFFISYDAMFRQAAEIDLERPSHLSQITLSESHFF